MANRQILTIKEAAERSKQEGYCISEYTLRRAIRSGAIPCRIVGKTYLIAWPNIVRWLMCEDGADNEPVCASSRIRRVEVS